MIDDYNMFASLVILTESYTALNTIKIASNPQANFPRNIGAWQRYPSSPKIIEALDERLVPRIEVVLTCIGGKTQPNCSYQNNKKIQGVYIPDICHFFTQAKFLENKIYTEKTRKLRQNTQ